MTTHYVYWLRDPSCTRIDLHGYVGVTKNPQKRLSQHRHDCKRYGRLWSPEEMVIICTGTESECLDMEFKLRPDFNIGWNTKPGGDSQSHWPDEYFSR